MVKIKSFSVCLKRNNKSLPIFVIIELKRKVNKKKAFKETVTEAIKNADFTEVSGIVTEKQLKIGKYFCTC